MEYQELLHNIASTCWITICVAMTVFIVVFGYYWAKGLIKDIED